jgi:wyosine [tRNA(Phe)-imidazoG37] synthetase (radical SAM superfamily)
MEISNLIIEVTRQCNLNCSHCLRGEPRQQNLDLEKLATFLRVNRVKRIHEIAFTGGEPLLVPKILKNLLKLIKEDLKIEIGSSFIATNGTVATDESIGFLLQLSAYCAGETWVAVSNGAEHEEALYELDLEEKFLENKKILSCLKFIDYNMKHRVYNRNNLLNEGRCDYGRREVTPADFDIKEDFVDCDELYFNVEGDLFTACNLSYDSQDAKKFYVGNYAEFPKKGNGHE